jgi:hypothetical protein
LRLRLQLTDRRVTVGETDRPPGTAPAAGLVFWGGGLVQSLEPPGFTDRCIKKVELFRW